MQNYIELMKSYTINYGLNIVFAILILIVGLWIAKSVSRIVSKILDSRNIDPTLSKFLTNLVKIILMAFVVIAAIDQVGIATTSFIALLGAAGLAIGFALQGSLSNFASGVMLIIFKPLKVGDYIEGGGVAGSVDEVGIFATVLSTPDNKVIYVPNSKLTSDIIVNYSTRDTRRVDMVFGIGYSDDIDKAKNVIQDVIKNDPRILDDPAPQIVVGELADSSVNFKVRPWVKSADYWSVYFDLTETIKKKFDENNISIPFPQTDVHLFQNKL